MPGHFTFYSHQIENNVAYFDENETRHAIQVLRYEVGSEINFTNGMGQMFYGNIKSISKKQFSVEITKTIQVEKPAFISVACGIIKSGDRMDWVVEKCTELGVSEILFLKTDNSERAVVNTERMLKVAIAALKQSHGAWLPVIKSDHFQSLLQNDAEVKLITMLHQDSKPISEMNLHDSVLIAVGPEGDFSDNEKSRLLDNGFLPVSLGHSVLRTETVCIAAAAYIAFSV